MPVYRDLQRAAEMLSTLRRDIDSVILCARFLRLKLGDGNTYPDQTPEALATQLFAVINRMAETSKGI